MAKKLKRGKTLVEVFAAEEQRLAKPDKGGRLRTGARSCISGALEIDHSRGVIYFHAHNPDAIKRFGSVTLLRICGLPKPIPNAPLDITLVTKTIRQQKWLVNYTGEIQP